MKLLFHHPLLGGFCDDERNEDRRITVTDCDTYDYFEELMKVRLICDGSG